MKVQSKEQSKAVSSRPGLKVVCIARDCRPRDGLVLQAPLSVVHQRAGFAQCLCQCVLLEQVVWPKPLSQGCLCDLLCGASLQTLEFASLQKDWLAAVHQVSGSCAWNRKQHCCHRWFSKVRVRCPVWARTSCAILALFFSLPPFFA